MGKKTTIDTSTLPRCPTCGRIAPEGMKAMASVAGKAKNPRKGFGSPEVLAKMLETNRRRWSAYRAEKAKKAQEKAAVGGKS